jgi:hypothetical protein
MPVECYLFNNGAFASGEFSFLLLFLMVELLELHWQHVLFWAGCRCAHCLLLVTIDCLDYAA